MRVAGMYGVMALSLAALGLEAAAQTVIRKAKEPMPDAKLAAIPDFVLPAKYKDRQANPLPASVDNSKQKHFVPLVTWFQQGNSCANAQSVTVIYGYDALNLRNVAAHASIPDYTYEYTYHFLNGGDQADGGDGWMFVEAWDILKETGAPTSTDFGGLEWGNSFGGWMNGYDKYYRAMQYRVDQYYKIDASVPAGDELIKQYLHDRADGSPVGGNLVVQVSIGEGVAKSTIQGRRCFTAFGTGGGHALTIVGYDDAFNGGSWLLYNTHGDGLYWAKYSLFRAGGTIATAQGTPVMFPRLKKNYSPRFALKVTLTHNQRGSIALLAGAAASASAAAPTKTKDFAGAFNFSGGAFPLGGRNQRSTLEIGLDVTDLAPVLSATEGAFFLQVVSKGGAGTIDTVSLMDYSTGQVRPIRAAETGKAIAANATTTVAIPWTDANVSIREMAGPRERARAASGPFFGGYLLSPEGGLRDILGRKSNLGKTRAHLSAGTAKAETTEAGMVEAGRAESGAVD